MFGGGWMSGQRWVGGKAILRTADRSQKWQGVRERDTHLHTHTYA